MRLTAGHRSNPGFTLLPAKDYICLEWPEANLEGNQFQLFNRWGAEVQSASFSGSCVDLIALPADTYVMLIILADGAMFKSWITIQNHAWNAQKFSDLGPLTNAIEHDPDQ